MKNGKMTEYDREVSETIYYIKEVAQTKEGVSDAARKVFIAIGTIHRIPGLPVEAQKEWVRKCQDVCSNLRDLDMFLEKEGHRLEWQYITSQEVPGSEEEEG